MNAPIPATAFRAADRLGAIGVSEIVRLTQEANQLKRQGQPVIVLGLGEPDFAKARTLLVHKNSLTLTAARNIKLTKLMQSGEMEKIYTK